MLRPKTYHELQLGQSIQEWTKWNLWRTAFKKVEVIWSAADHITWNFLKAVFPKFHLVHSWIFYPNCSIETLFRMGPFGAVHGCVGAKRPSSLIPCLKKIQNLYNVTRSLSSADRSIFFTRNQQLLLYQEM